MENNTAGRTDAGTLAGGDTASAGTTDNAGRGGQNLIDRAEAQARARLNATKKDAALTLSSVASTLLSSSSQLKDEQQNLAGEYVEKAAEQIDRLAHYIQNADPGEVADNVEQFARRRPAVFIGAAFALGVIGARFLKSSRRRIQQDDRLYSPGLSDREVPTQRSVETGSSAGAGLGSADMYGDGGFSASAGMPGTVPLGGASGSMGSASAGGAGGAGGTSSSGGSTTGGDLGRGGSGELP